jgi:GMP synthase (glutamine-hydrolysing)
MILVVDMNCKKDSLGFHEFVLPIIEVIKPLDKWSVKHYLEVSDADLNHCDGVILSGNALKDVATLNQPEKFQWLKATEKPILGICAGMETIGVVFGARLTRFLEIGMTAVKTVKENPLCQGDFKVYSLHSVCVEPSVDFEVWAKSAQCVQVIKHKRKRIHGVLFHPEVRNQEILKRFVQVEKIQQ